MPQGDWHPESRLKHRIVNVQLTDNGEVHHIGVGYEIVSPNGTVLAERGWSWPIPKHLREQLASILAEMNNALVEHEGLAGMDFQSFPGPTPERMLADAAT